MTGGRGRLTVVVPAPWCDLAVWRVRAGQAAGGVNEPIEVPAGPTRVVIDADVTLPAVRAGAALRLSVDVPSGGAVRLHPPLLPYRALPDADGG
ncbi:MAG TPA: hypothetical protein VNU01_07650 [Egibacteraceae bacterium]|nr:hypothetical protein [Egibacteraceae bacterium]